MNRQDVVIRWLAHRDGFEILLPGTYASYAAEADDLLKRIGACREL